MTNQPHNSNTQSSWRRRLSNLRSKLSPRSRWHSLFFIACAITTLPSLVFVTFDSTSFFVRDNVVCIGAALLGFMRVLRFHPAMKKPYQELLKTTPWTPKLTLPMGDVRLTLWDAPFLLSLVLLVALAPVVSPMRPLVCFGFGFVVATGLMLSPKEFAPWCTVVFSGAVMVRFWLITPLALAATIVAICICHWANRRGLAAFYRALPTDVYLPIILREQAERRLAWPLEPLAPQDSRAMRPKLGRLQRVTLSLLIGFCCYATVAAPTAWDTNSRFAKAQETYAKLQRKSKQRKKNRRTDIHVTFINRHNLALGLARCLVVFGGTACALGSLSRYMGVASPISFWGRIATGRWIIPQYDQRYMCGILIFMQTWFFYWALGAIDSGSATFALADFTCAAVTFVGISSMMITLMFVGPDVHRWKLTAPCRITSAQYSRHAFINKS